MLEFLNEIYKYVIGFLLAIFLTPIRKLLFSEEDAYCSFVIKGHWQRTGNPIKITKWFRKTTSINCGYFKERKQQEFQNKKFLYCSFGIQIKNRLPVGGGYCPFDKIPKF